MKNQDTLFIVIFAAVIIMLVAIISQNFISQAQIAKPKPAISDEAAAPVKTAIKTESMSRKVKAKLEASKIKLRDAKYWKTINQ